MDLRGKNVVITGGSRGIGAALADAFSRSGANVHLLARAEDRLAEVAERVAGTYGVADLSDDWALAGIVDECLEQLGSIDVWVNNAGIEVDGSFVWAGLDDLRTLARLNFEAPLLLTRAVLPHMLERGSGHIVQVSSSVASAPLPGLAAYGGSKAGLSNFSEGLRAELVATGVGLTVVEPGPVSTEMWDRIDADGSYHAPVLRRFKRLGLLTVVKPEKIAKATVTAVEKDKPYVRLPRRLAPVSAAANIPRRGIALMLRGLDLRPPRQLGH